MNRISKKVLILSTGGSAEPLITAIKKHCPSYVIFFCSDTTPSQVGSYIMVNGPGEPCKNSGAPRPTGVPHSDKSCPQCGSRYAGTMPSIVKQAGLGEEYESYEKVITPSADSLPDCYNCSREAIRIARERFPQAKLIIDYTGGTKTMSAGLAMAGIDDGTAEMFIVSANRIDLIKVASGMENIRKVDQIPLFLQRWERNLSQLFASYDYEGCLRIVDEMSSMVISGSDQAEKVQFYQNICKSLLAWDRFMHDEAVAYLKPYAVNLIELNVFLGSIIKSKQDYEKQSRAACQQGEALPAGVKANLSMVHDLLRNAERCLIKQQEVDAVGRTYRALELLAQTCLLYQTMPINTSDVKVENLPTDLQEKYQRLMALQVENAGEKRVRSLQLPLFRAYDLLADLAHPLGLLARERQEAMRNHLQIRNYAIIAHGINPVTAADAKQFYDFTCKLLEDGEAKMNVKGRYYNATQFPRVLPFL